MSCSLCDGGFDDEETPESAVDHTALEDAARALLHGNVPEALEQLERALIDVHRPAFGRLRWIIESHFSAKPPGDFHV